MIAETKTIVSIPQKVEQQILAQFFGISVDAVKRDRYSFHIEGIPVDKLNNCLKEHGIKETENE